MQTQSQPQNQDQGQATTDTYIENLAKMISELADISNTKPYDRINHMLHIYKYINEHYDEFSKNMSKKMITFIELTYVKTFELENEIDTLIKDKIIKTNGYVSNLKEEFSKTRRSFGKLNVFDLIYDL